MRKSNYTGHGRRNFYENALQKWKRVFVNLVLVASIFVNAGCFLVPLTGNLVSLKWNNKLQNLLR